MSSSNAVRRSHGPLLAALHRIAPKYASLSDSNPCLPSPLIVASDLQFLPEVCARSRGASELGFLRTSFHQKLEAITRRRRDLQNAIKSSTHALSDTLSFRARRLQICLRCTRIFSALKMFGHESWVCFLIALCRQRVPLPLLRLKQRCVDSFPDERMVEAMLVTERLHEVFVDQRIAFVLGAVQ